MQIKWWLAHRWRLIFLIKICLLFFVYLTTKAYAGDLRLAVFDTPLNHHHSNNVIQTIESQVQKCKKCKIELIPIYDMNGNLLLNQFLSELKKIDSNYKVINLSWNLPYEEKYFSIVKELNRITQSGVVVIAAGGVETEDRPAVDIAETVIGRVDKIIIVGELVNNKLSSKAYYGKKILIALPEDAKLKGSSFSAAKVSGQILNIMNLKDQKNFDWHQHFKTVKLDSIKMWPNLEDYFKN